ncbi:MAG: hypothetical protein ABJP79_16145 [Tateyamaria sp.]|uniref:hypothetical protein n=1 Tax=Tateyamaria sp. TaxID=1929288 RepID=UPI0032A083DA
MATLHLKAPVGKPGKTGNAKQVKNKPADVVVLRRMLIANGYKLPGEGGFDAKLSAVIIGAQKKAGIKDQDCVVMPGDKVCKALTPKYVTQEKQAANVKMVTFKIGGTTYELSPEDHKAAVAKLFKKIEPATRKLISQVDYTMDRYQFYLDTATMKNNIAMALVQASIMAIGRIDFPDDKKMVKALTARHELDRSLRSKDLQLYCKAMRTAERDINAFVKEFRAYVQKMDGNGSAIQGALEVVKSTSFAAVEILAVPVVMTYTRLPPDKAYLASKTAVAGIESLATDLGKQISGQKVNVSGSLGRAGYAMARELVLGWCGGKIKFKGPLLTRTMKMLGPALTKAFPFIPKGVAANFAARYLQGMGEEGTKAILEALTKGVESWIKKGKPPSKSEIDKLFDGVVKATALGGLGKNLGRFNDTWTAKSPLILRHKMIVAGFRKVDSKSVITAVHREALATRIMGKVQDLALTKGYDNVFSQATGNESASALAAQAEKALKSDREITAQIEAMIAAEVKAQSKK